MVVLASSSRFFNANFLSSVHIPLRLWLTGVSVYTSPVGREKK